MKCCKVAHHFKILFSYLYLKSQRFLWVWEPCRMASLGFSCHQHCLPRASSHFFPETGKTILLSWIGQLIWEAKKINILKICAHDLTKNFSKTYRPLKPANFINPQLSYYYICCTLCWSTSVWIRSKKVFRSYCILFDLWQDKKCLVE